MKLPFSPNSEILESLIGPRFKLESTLFKKEGTSSVQTTSGFMICTSIDIYQLLWACQARNIRLTYLCTSPPNQHHKTPAVDSPNLTQHQETLTALSRTRELYKGVIPSPGPCMPLCCCNSDKIVQYQTTIRLHKEQLLHRPW